MKDLTLCCVDCANQALSLRAMAISLPALPFARAVFLTIGNFTAPGIESIQIPAIQNRADYSRFIVKELGRHIDTGHVLLIQWDGYVANPSAWSDEFLEYDYIGAPWGFHNDDYRVGNGGFSLRSKRLLNALLDPEITDPDPEDEAICRHYRPLLEQRYGIRFAPEKIAARFSFETTYPQGIPFGFHALYNMWMVVAPDEFDRFLSMLSPQILASPQLLQLGCNYKDLGKTWESTAILRRRLQVMPNDRETAALLGTLTPPPPAARTAPNRNAPCPCGSGKRYKECCGRLTAPASQAKAAQPNVNDLLKAAMQLHQAGKLFEAGALYELALRLEPDNVFAMHYSGVIQMQQGRQTEAEQLLRQSIAAKPEMPDFHNNLGLCLRAQNRLEEAIECYRTALSIDSGYAEGFNNLGLDLQQTGRVGEAQQCFESALAIRPEFAQAHWNLGLALLLQGIDHRGWEEYEWRLKCPEFSLGGKPPAGVPYWHSEPLEGKTLLLLSEQGAGDNFQFIRYAKILADLGARVLVEAAAETVELLASAPGVEKVLATDELSERPDYCCPLLSLPYRCRNLTQGIPAEVPYLTPPPSRIGQWSQRLEAYAGPKVGLVWAGSPGHANDRNRSCRLADLAPLFDRPEIHWFSLQKGPAAGQLKQAAPAEITDLGPMLDDFSDTAAAIARLDLVITVDTSVAHLAGALNRPCWVLLPYAPDFRWQLERADCDWYPSLRLFRQKMPGDWRSLVAATAEALATRFGN